MDLNQAAEIARLMTDSTLTNSQIIMAVSNIPRQKRDAICPEVDIMVKQHNLPFDKAYPLVKEEFKFLATQNNLDAAVLFWLYMEWIKK